MTAGVETDFCQPALQFTVMTILNTLEVGGHVVSAATLVASQVGDRVPITVVRRNENHSVVSGTPTQCSSPWIEDSVHTLALGLFHVVRIEALQIVAGMVPDKEIPPHRLVLRSKGMEGWDVVVAGQALEAWVQGVAALELSRITTRLQHHDRESCLRQAGRYSTPASAAADDYITPSAP